MGESHGVRVISKDRQECLSYRHRDRHPSPSIVLSSVPTDASTSSSTRSARSECAQRDGRDEVSQGDPFGRKMGEGLRGEDHLKRTDKNVCPTVNVVRDMVWNVSLWIPAFPKGMPSARGNDIYLRSPGFAVS